jgi:hypothetical protein
MPRISFHFFYQVQEQKQAMAAAAVKLQGMTRQKEAKKELDTKKKVSRLLD